MHIAVSLAQPKSAPTATVQHSSSNDSSNNKFGDRNVPEDTVSEHSGSEIEDSGDIAGDDEQLWTTVYVAPANRQSLGSEPSEKSRAHSEIILDDRAEMSSTLPAENDTKKSPHHHTVLISPNIPRESEVMPDAKLSSNAWHILYHEVQTLFTNRDYIFLFLAFTLIIGVLNGLLPLFNQILEPHGYTNSEAGTLAAVIIVVGLIGAVVGGILMEKTKAYRAIFKSYMVLAGFAGLLFFSLMYKDNFWPLLCAAGLLGFVALPLLPIMMELCAECTYPIPEEISTGILHNGGNAFGVAVVFIVQSLLTVQGPGPTPFLASTIFILAINVLTAVFALNFHGRYLRLEHESPLVDHSDIDSDPRAGHFHTKNPLQQIHIDRVVKGTKDNAVFTSADNFLPVSDNSLNQPLLSNAHNV